MGDADKTVSGLTLATLPLAGTAIVPVDTGAAELQGVTVANLRGYNTQIFTAAGTWTKPPGATMVEITMYGGGGGGGSGKLAATGAAASGGGGGAGGAIIKQLLPASAFADTVAVAFPTTGFTGVGTGIGGLGQTTNDAAGLPGNDGIGVTFGHLIALGGVGGLGGTTNGSVTGGGSRFTNLFGNSGGGPVGQAGSAGTPAKLTSVPNTQPGFPTAAGGGGGVDASNVASNGGQASDLGSSVNGVIAVAGAIGGIAPGGAGNTGNPQPGHPGCGGSGGAGGIAVNGGRGGNGSQYGAGGGGGGASRNGLTSGAGGNGAPPIAIITSW